MGQNFVCSILNNQFVTVASESIQLSGTRETIAVSICATDAIGGLPVVRIRVALADDHYSVVARVRETLGDEFEVIGTAENGNQTVDAVPRLDADVL